MTANLTPRVLTYVNSGNGGTPSWYGLVRLQADVIDHEPDVVFVDFAVNDADMDAAGSRSDGFAPAAEALLRRLRTDLPNAQIIVWVFTWPADYSYMSAARENARDKWVTLANTYGLTLLRWDTYLESLMGGGYGDGDVEVYLAAANNVHPNDAGHLAAYNLLAASVSSVRPSGQVSPLPTRVYSEAADYEETPIARVGNDNDGETGTGWSTDGTARQSSTADDTISWSGTFCSFGLDTNYGGGAGVLAWDVDGGGYTNIDLSAKGVADNAITNFTRDAHTVTIKVISGTVKINRFLAI